MRSIPAALALVAVAPVIHAQRSEACSPDSYESMDWTLTGRTLPENGSTDVPINARIFIETTRGSPISRHLIKVQRGDDEPVTPSLTETRAGYLVEPGALRANAGDLLEPFTTYTVEVYPPGADPEAGVPELAVVFTTGDALDEAPPTLTGDVGVETEYEAGAAWFLICPTPDTNLFTVTPPAVDADVVEIQLVEVRSEGQRSVVDARPAGEPLVHRNATMGEVRYELLAIDIAGNASQPLVVDTYGPNGCGCSADGSTGASTMGAALVALALRRRRVINADQHSG